MELKNINSININENIISDIILNYSDLGKCDKSTSIASLDVLKKFMLESIYPVGSIYMSSTNSTIPVEISKLGTWSQITGKYLYANKSPGIGGNDKMTSGMLPKHQHSINITSSSNGYHNHKILAHNWERGGKRDGTSMAGDAWASSYITPNWIISEDGQHSHDVNGDTGYSGTGTASLLPEYQSVYAWVRTS